MSLELWQLVLALLVVVGGLVVGTAVATAVLIAINVLSRRLHRRGERRRAQQELDWLADELGAGVDRLQVALVETRMRLAREVERP